MSTARAFCIFGPTASGKTRLAIRLAKAVNGEIINADSRQIYKHIPIITAAPSAEEYAQVPHHLFEFLELYEPFSAGDYARSAAQVAEDIVARGKIPIFVGGTGLYLDAIVRGLSPMPVVTQAIKQQLDDDYKNLGLTALLSELRSVDDTTFQRVDKHNPARVMRALAVFRQTNIPLSIWQEQPRAGNIPLEFTKISLLPKRDVVYANISKRLDTMLKNGLLEEIKALVDEEGNLPPYPALTSLGVEEIYQYICGKLSWVEAADTYVQSQRRYAKRQYTWAHNSYMADITLHSPDATLPVA